jgi:hypothetical protein
VAFAVDQLQRAEVDLAFEHLAVAGEIVTVGLEAQEVCDPHGQFGAIDRLAEELLGARVETEHPGIAIVQGGNDS